MSHPPTPEQQAAIEAYGTGDDLVIQAGAGTGKTSTLRMLAESAPRRRGLYVAFNRAIAADAQRSFPRSVQASTAHSLAFRAVGHQYKDRLDGPRVPARLAAQYLGINGPTHIGDDVPILAPQQTARIVMGTVARFARSADTEPHAGHLPHVTRFDTAAQRQALATEILPLAQEDADPGELRLAYVAVTRARLVLDRGSLRWLDTYATPVPIPASERHQDAPTPPSGQSASNASAIEPLRPADDLPAGAILCGPNGRLAPEDLDPEDSLTVRLFIAWNRERKTIREHYDPLIAAATPGTPEYTRLADERTKRLRQLNDQYEAASSQATR